MAKQPKRTAEQVKEEILQKRAMREHLVGEMGYTFPNSNIDPTMPEEGNATTASVRENFAYSKYEIESLQAAVNNIYNDIRALEDEYVNITGDILFGHISLDPSVTEEFGERDYVTKSYVDNLGTGGGDGSAFPDAPNDGKLYGRQSESWAEVVIPEGGTGAGLVISDTEPTDKVEGMQWLDTTTSQVFIWDGDKWLEFPAGSSGGGIEEAPEDGKTYARKDAAWTEITSTGSTVDVEWSDIQNKPTEIDALDGTVGSYSMVSGGTY